MRYEISRIQYKIQNKLSWISLKWICKLNFSNLAECTHHIFSLLLIGIWTVYGWYRLSNKSFIVYAVENFDEVKWNRLCFILLAKVCEEITKFSRRNGLGVKSLKGLTFLSKPRAHTDHTSSKLNKHNQKHHSGDRGYLSSKNPWCNWSVWFSSWKLQDTNRKYREIHSLLHVLYVLYVHTNPLYHITVVTRWFVKICGSSACVYRYRTMHIVFLFTVHEPVCKLC